MLADMKVRKYIRLLFSYLLLAFMAVIIVYPLLWTAGASFNPGNSLISTSIIPKHPTFDHYKELFAGKESIQYVQWYVNSMKISLFTMAGSLLCVTFTAYAFSRFRFKGRKYALTLFLLLQMIPQFSALIALFVLAQILGMINSHWLLILLYIGGLIPMNTYLMKGYMDSIPMDLDESAKIDGASSIRIFFQIILPLSKPMAAVVAMNGFTGPLGDFVLSSTILRTPESYTLPVGLFNLVNDVMGASYTTFAAGALLISIPVAVIFIMLQKNFVSGLTAGGTKG
ncbi:arabinogalactan oligomer ABC transporter permease GanQ [Bacillus subtilis subsp. subtilis]|uniref:arabinogalactan oligomer ABC transporter permease GanQ n=1 Tax=Bacillus subtilis TaxID=1423 RepID=UPI00034C4824|nr:arabinogalactan oligomer ABC transporter permease GanQ [Bacillus subtilis]KIN36875.1 hypothetical protein B4070_3519 [Bacillus subtilis]MBP3046068.1 arabinogalactan oligomer ABC transporter permease GanQ [Bacillus subtilis subsp. subtilis]